MQRASMPHDANVVSPDANWKGDNNGEHVGRDETARPFSARLPRWGRGERGGGHPRRLRRQCNEHARTGGQADDGPGCGKQRGAHDGSEQRLRRRPTTAPATTGTTAPTAAAVATSASTTGSAAAPTTAASSAVAATTVAGKPGGSILIGTLGEASTINPVRLRRLRG